MRSLEEIVRSCISSISRAEDYVVNFAYASEFAVNHPLISSLAVGGAIFSLMAVPDAVAAASGGRVLNYSVASSLAVPSAMAGLTGAYVYRLAKSHRLLHDAGLSTEKIYQKSRYNDSRNSVLRIGGAAAVTSGVLTLGNSMGNMRETPAETLAQLSIAATPVIYGSARRVINDMVTSKISVADRARLLFSGLTGNKRMMTDMFRKLAAAEPSFENVTALSDAYIREGMLDEGVIELRNALQIKEAGNSGMRATGKIWATAAALNAIESREKTHADYVYAAGTAQYVDSSRIAKETIRRLTVDIPGIESDILGAMFLEAGGDPEAYDYWNSAAAAVFSDQRLKVYPVSEQGIHNTRRYGPTPIIAGTFVFKGSREFDEMAFEKSVLSYVSSIADDPYFIVPQVIAEFTHSNGGVTHDLILRYLEGMSPSEMQRKGMLTQENLFSIITYLAWIHKNVPAELSRKGPVDFDGKRSQIMSNPNLGLPYRIRENIGTRIQSILSGQKQSPFVIGKDPHPAQWRFGKDYLAALDWEDMGATSMFVDGAKFYVHPDLVMGADILDPLHGEAAKLYDANGLFKNDSEFRIRLLDAMIYQTLSFISAWSSPGMEHLKDRRAGVLHSAGEAFRMIKTNHEQHYRLNRRDYDALENSFREVRELLEV